MKERPKMTNVGAGFVIATILYFPLAAINGIVASQLWTWFVVPLGMPALSMVNAIGISLIFLAWFPYSVMLVGEREEMENYPDRFQRALMKAGIYVLTDLILLAYGFVWSLAR